MLATLLSCRYQAETFFPQPGILSTVLELYLQFLFVVCFSVLLFWMLCLLMYIPQLVDKINGKYLELRWSLCWWNLMQLAVDIPIPFVGGGGDWAAVCSVIWPSKLHAAYHLYMAAHQGSARLLFGSVPVTAKYWVERCQNISGHSTWLMSYFQFSGSQVRQTWTYKRL